MEKVQADKYDFIIVGGGIAGTTCANRLCRIVNSNDKILIISATSMVKLATNMKLVTKFLREFDVEDKNPETLTDTFKNLTVVHKYVTDLNSHNHKIICDDGTEYIYDKLCIATGGRPRLIAQNNEYVLGIRDTETVISFQKRLSNARQILLVGNGGIATEMCYEIENCKIIWAIKDNHISHQFLDSYAAKFFENKVRSGKKPDEGESSSPKRSKYTIKRLDIDNQTNAYGSALGPDWLFSLTMKGSNEIRKVTIEYNCEVKLILKRDEYLKKNCDCKNEDWPVYVELTNGKIYGCDFIVSATGVTPAVDEFTKNNKFELAEDGGIRVNDKMETNIPDIYAVGDACTASWNLAPHWFQMRLWNQASQMGDYAARSMWAKKSNQKICLDFCFEMFAHITKFFGYKVILLGKYDARDLGDNYQLLLRCTEGVELVKIVLHQGKVYGALLIGETDLEETFENLILNQLDISAFGEDLINPDIDIEDYFD